MLQESGRKPRVTEKRFRHVEGVAAVGRDIAKLAGEDALLPS